MYYYLTYDEGIESLINLIKTRYLDGTVEDNLIAENDIVLIHLIFRINTNTGIYRKKEIQAKIWNLLKDNCEVSTEFPYTRTLKGYQIGFEKLFNYCWNQKFSLYENGRKAIELKKKIYRRRPFSRRLVDNNVFLALSFIFFLILIWFIDKETIDEKCFFGLIIR